MTLEERLAAKLAAHDGKGGQRVRNRCKARSQATKHDPDELFRCVKEARHEDPQHEDDYGSKWTSEPHQILLWLGPGSGPARRSDRPGRTGPAPGRRRT